MTASPVPPESCGHCYKCRSVGGRVKGEGERWGQFRFSPNLRAVSSLHLVHFVNLALTHGTENVISCCLISMFINFTFSFEKFLGLSEKLENFCCQTISTFFASCTGGLGTLGSSAFTVSLDGSVDSSLNVRFSNIGS